MAVRRESVELSLIDNFSAGIIRAAAATEILNKRLDSLSGEAIQTSKTTRDLDSNTDSLGKTSARTEKDIDKLSGRLRILSELAAITAPAVADIGAVGVAGLSGLTSQFGFAAAGAGTAILAFQGVGDALKAMNKAQLEPSVENLEAARVELARLSPAAASFAEHLMRLQPDFEKLRDTAASGLFPGVEDGLDGLEKAFPRVQTVVASLSTELGDIAREAGISLGSDRWAPFIDFLGKEGPSALADFATAAGNTAHALAGLWMATDPLNDDFSSWLVGATASLDKWAEGVGKTQGFADFVSYVEKTGPQVAATLGAIANAALQISEAAAPLGGPVLKGLEGIANALSAVADSDLGTPIFAGIAALSLYNRTLAVTKSLQKSAFGQRITPDGGFKAQIPSMQAFGLVAQNLGQSTKYASEETLKARESVRTFGATAGRVAGPVAGLAVASTGVADKFGLTNTASLALAGSMFGLGGAAAGAVVGGFLDMAHAGDKAEDTMKRVDLAIRAGDWDSVAKGVKSLKAQLDDLEHPGFLDSLKTVAFGPIGIAQRASTKAALEREIAEAALAKTLAQRHAADDFANQGLQATGAGLESATMSADAFAASIQHANDVLSGRASIRDYEAALDDFSAALDKNGRTLDVNTAKGRENQAALDAIAGQALAVAKSITNPVLRSQFLDNARTQFIKAATKAGLARQAARDLATQIGLLNTVKGTPKINTNSLDSATAKASNLLNLLNRIVNHAPPSIAPGHKPGTSPGHGFGELLTPADGMFVPKTGLHYADRHPALLADGEAVISNRYGQVDRNAGLLKAINENRYADGRVTSGSSTSKNRDVLTRTEYVDALSSLIDGLNSTLGLGATGPGAEVRAAFKSFADQIRQDGGKVGSRFHVLEEQLVRTAVALDRQKTKLDGLNTSLDDLKQSASSLASSVASGFTTDIFAQGYDPFADSDQAIRDAGGTPATHSQAAILGAGLQQVLQDAKNASQFASDIDSLKQKGFGGSGLEALANSNNLSMADALLGLSPQALQAANTAFARRSQTLNAAGNTVSNAVFGDAMAKLTAEVSSAKAEIAALTKVEKDGVSAIKALPPAIGKATTASLNGVAHAASMEAGR